MATLTLPQARLSSERAFYLGMSLAMASTVFVGFHARIVPARRPGGFIGIPVPAIQFLVVPIVDMVLFGSFVALAVVRRRDTQAHKRWMLLATINLTTAAIARWPGVISLGAPPLFFFLSDLFVVALVVWDWKSRGRVHTATGWGGALIVLSLRLALSGTAAWLAFAGWLLLSPL